MIGMRHAVEGAALRVISILWLACFAFAVLAQAGATWRFALYQFTVNPAFASVGLYVQNTDRPDTWSFTPVSKPAIEAKATGWLAASDGTPIPAERAAREISGPDGQKVILRVRSKDAWRDIEFVRSAANRVQVFDHQIRWYGLMSHFADLAIALALIAVACILRLRRSKDLTAGLVSLALLLIATLGCWRLWEWLGLPSSSLEVSLNGIWLGLLLVAVPALPSGRYRPPGARWFILLGPAVTLLLILNRNAVLDSLITAAGGVALLAAVVVRMQRTPFSQERHQLSWALLGVTGGVLLWLPGGSIEAHFWSALPTAAKVLVFVSTRCGLLILAFALMLAVLGGPEGELAARLRARTYAAITVAGTGLWAVIAYYSGEAVRKLGEITNEPLALAISAVIGVALIAPLRKWLRGGVDQLFRGELIRLAALHDRIRHWDGSADPAGMADRALRGIAMSSEAEAAALFLAPGEGDSARLLAAYNLDAGAAAADLAAADGSAPRRLPLRVESSEGPDAPLVLLLGRRGGSDYYSKDERSALAAIVDDLAEILRRAARHSALETRLAGMAEELRRLSSER